MNRYLYLLNYFNIVNSTLNQKSKKYAENIREANEMILSNQLNSSQKKTLLLAMGDFVGSTNIDGKYLIEDDRKYSNKKFNHGQYKFLELFLDNQNYSFSMPTSFGKSFLTRQLVKEIINKNKRILIVVPTLALMQEYFNAFFENDFKASTQVDQNNIHILTQERAFLYAFKENDYVIFDEAYESFEDEERAIFTSKIIIEAIKCKSIVKLLSPNLLNPLDIIPESIKEKFKTFVLNHTLTSRSIEKHENLELFIKNISLEKKRWIIYCTKTKMYEISKKILSYSISDFSFKNILIDNFLTKQYSEDFLLIKFLKNGIAVHNSEIPKDIRFISEILFKAGVLKILLASTTIVQGINLKANNLAILSRVTKGSFTKFMKRNLIGRVGRYDKQNLKLRHGRVVILDKNMKIEDFDELNNLNLLNYEKTDRNKEIKKVKNQDKDFNTSVKDKKEILDYIFKDKDLIISIIKENEKYFNLEKNYLTNENIPIIAELLKIILENLLKVDLNKKKLFTISISNLNTDKQKIIDVLKRIVTKKKPYNHVINLLIYNRDNRPNEKLKDVIANHLTNEELFYKENSEIYNDVVFERVIREISRRNFIKDVLLTKLKISIFQILKIKVEFEEIQKKYLENIPEALYESYENLNEEVKKEIKKFMKY